MKHFIKNLLFLFLPVFVAAQDQTKSLESLHPALKNTNNDTAIMLAKQNLMEDFLDNNWDSALLIGDQGLLLARKIHQPLEEAWFLFIKAYCLAKNGNYPLAYKLINEGMEIAKNEKNEKKEFTFRGKKVDINPHENRLKALSAGKSIFGHFYRTIGNQEKSIAYYQEAILIGLEIEDYNILQASCRNLASIYFVLNQLDSAITYARKALALSDKTGDKDRNGSVLKNMGMIFFKKNQLDSAKSYYWQAHNASRIGNKLSHTASINIALAELYESISQVDSMLYYAKAAYLLGNELKNGDLVENASVLIARAYQLQKNTDSAFTYLNLSKHLGDSMRKNRNDSLTRFQSINFEEQLQLEKKAQENITYQNKIRTIALFTGIGLLSLLAFVFYRNNRQKLKANKVLETTLSNLKSAQSQLIQSEKMASLGELTAGIAHEIQNPLNFVNNFSEVNKELIEELKGERHKAEGERNVQLENDLLNDIAQNEEKINHHGKRADAIVKGMLQHSRSSSGVKEPTDINALADEYLRLSYHGLRAKDKSFNATLKTDFDESIGNINIIPQDIGRVLLNLFNNAFYAAPLPPPEKNGINSGGVLDPNYFHNPTVWVSTKKMGDHILISVKDNGPGIPQKILDKIFQPFFTTKPTGQGTGLGLSLSYDIVKAHGGELSVRSPSENVQTTEGVGAEFIITLPFKTNV